MTLLSTDDYRALHETALEDPALQLLLDAAEADIVAFIGGNVQWIAGGQRVIALDYPASSITSIVEVSPYDGTSTTLAADDYLVDPTGFLLYRQGNGTHPRWHWWGRVVVTYTTADTEDQRKVVQADLVHLAETFAPGVTATTIGSWTEQLASNSVWNESTERAAILARLVTRGRMAVVGATW